jgi:hypothetical protein
LLVNIKLIPYKVISHDRKIKNMMYSWLHIPNADDQFYF